MPGKSECVDRKQSSGWLGVGQRLIVGELLEKGRCLCPGAQGQLGQQNGPPLLISKQKENNNITYDG